MWVFTFRGAKDSMKLSSGLSNSPAEERPHRPHVNGTASEKLEGNSVLEACRTGNVAAWGTFYGEHFDFVHRTARRLGALPSEAEDIAQETFLIAFRRLHTFRDGQVTTWLHRITANLVSAQHRKRRVREIFSTLVGRAEASHEAGPEELYVAVETQAQVADVMARLSPKKREVFALYELEELSGEAIAERLGLKIQTVWTRLHYARRDFERIGRKRGVFPLDLERGHVGPLDGDISHG